MLSAAMHDAVGDDRPENILDTMQKQWARLKYHTTDEAVCDIEESSDRNLNGTNLHVIVKCCTMSPITPPIVTCHDWTVRSQ